jgi:hypothetical protein
VQRLVSALVLIALFEGSVRGQGLTSVCVAPVPAHPSNGHRGVAVPPCEPDALSVKFDDAPATRWSHTASARIDGLNPDVRRRVVVLCDGKPHQSFRFSFSEFSSRDLCLSVNDLYRTVRLQDARSSPWCKCK